MSDAKLNHYFASLSDIRARGQLTAYVGPSSWSKCNPRATIPAPAGIASGNSKRNRVPDLSEFSPK